ncbi:MULTISPECIES: hypothetical protein [Streptomyces]|uniref:DUF8094 domain-containing protein n=2 Tax=Streptomyces rimosus subsp. rimosus TaxID=132474 RepID=A0A8A1V065_STRR1|nr:MULTISPECIES: hypothetical protein [Streptomyces]KOG84311.1 hypothetical protein ADK78_01115 [Kitasatospora aureofaciens]KOT28056.1 hypothetical protein ADK84_36980 [Streptomyces sp. NRRL WC-3701]MYT44854.1 hypothetical protein [Streptomyces sp. SID5471]QGY70342.1 hypothetical protein V519_034720 [Streptomyces rimosus R6-500]QST85830.1 hypothetical protein SRIM_011455 [Streptomyces rimosus subsp. rimosus ATCC 10970]RSO12378.1 hypothetical protein DMH18_06720 [Streptomyces sp. WAC 06783]
MTVHGEREMLPAVSKAEAATALKQFTDGFNASNSKLDPKVNPTYETESLLAVDQALTKAGHAVSPQGNPKFPPLTLTSPHFTVPRQAGWPKVFLADAVSNRNNTRWFLVFTRDAMGAKWKASYLSALSDNQIPQFKTDPDGYAEVVPADAKDSGLKVAPGELGKAYAAYLNTGKGEVFAPGPATDQWRKLREQQGRQPGARIQYEDQPSDYAPVALRTKDGGALVFFSTYYHQQKTVSEGARINIPPEIKGIMDGPAKSSNRMTFTTLSEQVVKVPAAGTAEKVAFLHRLEAKTSAKSL